MQERIVVENFGGLTKAEIDLKKINIFIGPQASGKSVLAKLIYFFKEIPDEFGRAFFNNLPYSEFQDSILEVFKTYFPTHTHPEKNFKIEYGTKTYALNKNDDKLTIECNRNLINQLDKNSLTKSIKDTEDGISEIFKKLTNVEEKVDGIGKSELVFVPAGRVLFASIQANIYSFLNLRLEIDPFLIKFGQYYYAITHLDSVLHIDEAISYPLDRLYSIKNYHDVLSGKYLRENRKDYLEHPDGRKVNISYASSGQQESLPLVLILNFIQKNDREKTVVFIEEPEAHLFPSAQKKIVELIAATFNANPERDIQFVITTHSPYILTSFNNLIQAGQLANTLPEDSLEKLYKVVPQNQLLHIEDIAAYAVADGTASDIIDKENNLINARMIDEVSNDIAIQFDSLLDLQ